MDFLWGSMCFFHLLYRLLKGASLKNMTFFQWERNLCVDQKFVFNFVFFHTTAFAMKKYCKLEKPLFLFLLVFWGISPRRRSLGRYAVGESLLYFYIPMFPWKDVLMGRIRKIQKHEEKGDRSWKFKKTRRKEWRKEKEEIFFYGMWRFPYSSCVLHCSETPSGYHHCATLPQENPLVWEPPLQKTTTQIGAWNKVICQVSVFFPLCWFATWNPFESHLWHHSFPSQVLSGYTTHLQVSFCLTH